MTGTWLTKTQENLTMKKQVLATAVAVALGTATPLWADNTTSSIRGMISTPAGEPAANTKIIITHLPTGSTRTFTTNDEGAFNASRLRVGGPYKVVIDSDTFQDKELNDINLSLDEDFILRETLAEDGTVEVITVSATGLRYKNSGSSSTFNAEAIENTPSVNRDLKDVLRRNPLVNVLDNDDRSISILGSNPRYNSITVDGVRQDDDFGLNGSGYATQRSSISLSAAEQVSVVTNPYDPSVSGFMGGGISVVTKSGTNEFKGSVFYDYYNDGLSGDATNDEGEEVELEYDERTFGFSLGGPIIKDKLFFFVNYEDYENRAGENIGPSDVPSASQALVSSADALEVIRIAQDVYGVDAGTWEGSGVEEDKKILAKIDWNINDFHRASFTYQNTDGERTSNVDGNDTLNLSSHWYARGDELTTYSAQWFADWTDSFSTELRVSHKDVDNKQVPLGGLGYGHVIVRNDDPSVEGGQWTVEFGPDEFRHANNLSNDTFDVLLDADYLIGDHTISFGLSYRKLDVFNQFVPTSLGIWTFSSLEDFANRTASDFEYSNAFTNNANDGAASFSSNEYAFYVGDVWDINDEVTLRYGVRYERYATDDEPALNTNFVARYGFGNNATVDGLDVILPRASVTWRATERLTLEGGVGRYAGGSPNVWFSNAYSNDGITIVSPDLSSIDESVYLENVDVTEVPQEVLDSMSAGNGNSTPIDPDFELPSEWRYSISTNYLADLGALGDDWNFFAELVYKDIESHAQWVDLARAQSGTTVEGRPIYSDRVGGAAQNQYDIMLTNVDDGGDGTILTLSLDKAFDNGLSFNTSYTYQDIEDRVPGTSSTATSNYQFTSVVDRQNPSLGTAAYEIEHRFALGLDYKVEFISGYMTRFGLIAERVSGRPYSWTLGSFRDDDFGDQTSFDDSDNYLPYIPTSATDPAIDFTCDGCLSYEEIINQLNERGISTEGGYLERNAYTAPWRTNIDLSVKQEIPGLLEGHKGILTFTIDNFLNFIDHAAGDIESNPFGENTQILFDYDINEAGQYQLREPFGGFESVSPAERREAESTWQVKVGVSYEF